MHFGEGATQKEACEEKRRGGKKDICSGFNLQKGAYDEQGRAGGWGHDGDIGVGVCLRTLFFRQNCTGAILRDGLRRISVEYVLP